MVITKSGDVTKQVSIKCSEENSFFGRGSLLLIIYYLSLRGSEWGGGGRFNFAAFRMDTYSRWALIRGSALIRINTVFNLSVDHFWSFVIDQQERIWCTNFSTAFRLRNFFFFLVFFLLFFLCHFLLYFLDLFFDSLPSLTHLSPSPPRPLCSRQEGTTFFFCTRPLPRLFRLLG